MKFIVEVPIKGYAYYEVEADSEEDAQHLIHTGCVPLEDSEWDLDYDTSRWKITAATR